MVFNSAATSLTWGEADNQHRQRAWTEPLPLYVCPSRRVAVAQTPRDDARGIYYGGGWAWGKIDYAANARVFPNRPQGCRDLATLTDGTSHTFLVAEKALDRDFADTGSWYWDEPFFLGGAGSTARDGTRLLRDAGGTFLAIRNNWGAAHPGGAQFLFADGSVRMVPYDTPTDQVRALLTPNGGEVAPSF